MSVLIKGMEMPTLCKTYKIRFAETNDGKIVVGIADLDSTLYRPVGEAVPVPPHWRLIDANGFAKELREDADINWNKKMAPTSWSEALTEIADMIDVWPAAIEAEER